MRQRNSDRTSGYSKKPLAEKLGVKPGFRVAVLNAPVGYRKKLGALPDGVTTTHLLEQPMDFIHFFVRNKAELEAEFARLKQSLAPDGMLWVSWPKGSSKVATDLNENIIREIGLQHGLVDVKVAAIDAVWSGLKFVYRLKDRK